MPVRRPAAACAALAAIAAVWAGPSAAATPATDAGAVPSVAFRTSPLVPGTPVTAELRCPGGTLSSEVFGATATSVAAPPGHHTATVTVRPGTAPGSYPATLTCGSATEHTTVTVAPTGPAAPPPTGGGADAAAGPGAGSGATRLAATAMDPRKQALPLAAGLVFLGALAVLARRLASPAGR
ncbi:hypothetical protein ACWGB8_28925 [Kitasatospora sp. NPDC054939]